MLNKYTVVGIHNSGLGLIMHYSATTAKQVLDDFVSLEKGVALAIFEGHLSNKVQRNLYPGSPTELED